MFESRRGRQFKKPGYARFFLFYNSTMPKKHILLTNDDGIKSPGLWAAAQALSALGYVHVVAPREQFSGAGRSLPTTTDGRVSPQEVEVNGQIWPVFAVGGSPAQAVLHGLLEILPVKPDLVVSGINFGENIGNGVTISGTVGAALEAASYGVPALAVSLETDPQHHFHHSDGVDFSTAAHFTQLFARWMLNQSEDQTSLPYDVDILKVDVPCDATPQTTWKTTRQSRLPYYIPRAQERQGWDDPKPVSYRPNPLAPSDHPGTDIYTLHVERLVSVTPLSLDLTSRVSLEDLDILLRDR